MKKILLFVAFCLFGLQMRAQVPIHIVNNSSYNLVYYLSGLGGNLTCFSKLTTFQLPLAAGTSVVYNSWSSGSWIQGGTSNVYTAVVAQSMFGQAYWTGFRYNDNNGCGLWLNSGICDGDAILSDDTLDMDCSINTKAQWINFGSYILVVINNA